MRRTAETAFSIGAFFLTGIGTAILGSTLPAVLHVWRLSDGRGGTLLLVGWGGSTAGALFVRKHPIRSAAAGLLLAGVALHLLAGESPSFPAVGYLAFGLGLGITMTSISLLRSRGLGPAAADLEMNRLNLVWAAGACVAPGLAIRSLHALSVQTLFRLFGNTLAVAGICGLLLALGHKEPAHPSVPKMTHRKLPWAPLRLGLSATASVGLESALGSWLTTYAGRHHKEIGVAVSANLAFWAGLLLSRAAHSLKSAPWLHTAAARWGHVLLSALGIVGLLAYPTAQALPWASLLCGLGLGPLYPFVLAVSLPRYRSTAVFVLAGVGAALVPWLTGWLSSGAGSLRLGLLVPLVMLLPLALANYRIEGHDLGPVGVPESQGAS